QTVTANFLTPSQLANRWTRSLNLIASGYDQFIQMGGAAGSLESYTGPVGELLAALPSASFKSSDAITETSEQTLETEVISRTTIVTQGGLGPGVGDILVYLANVRLIWTVINGEVFLSVLGWDTVVSASAASIQSEIRRLEQLPAGGG